MGLKKTYRILITEQGGESYAVEFKTNNINFSVEQYQRNRNPFTWEIIDVS